MARSPLVEATERAARASGLVVSLEQSTYDSANMGNGSATFVVGSLLVRVVRDRGQDFVDVAALSRPTRFFMFGDVEIAFGWRTVDEVLARKSPEPLSDVFARLATRMSVLSAAFEGATLDSALEKLESAATLRGRAFVARLR